MLGFFRVPEYDNPVYLGAVRNILFDDLVCGVIPPGIIQVALLIKKLVLTFGTETTISPEEGR